MGPAVVSAIFVALLDVAKNLRKGAYRPGPSARGPKTQTVAVGSLRQTLFPLVRH
jgi:hypothetical protein